MKLQRPNRQFLKSVVNTRKRLIRTGNSLKKAAHMETTIALAEQLLMYRPSEQRVQKFIRLNAEKIRDLIPARTATDKRFQTLNTIING